GRGHRSAAELTKSLSAIEARYAPECVTNCEMAFHCRAEARAAGAADVLGRSVRDALGGIETIAQALALADPSRTAAAAAAGGANGADRADGVGGNGGVGAGEGRGGHGEAARLLRAASRAYDEALLVAPRAAEPAPERAWTAAPAAAAGSGRSAAVPSQPSAEQRTAAA
ncbi:MAG TPA: hypothetical protein VH372_25015, partial [Actinospica sp.]|nr:hypothetical protein [Actinospica sp.]